MAADHPLPISAQRIRLDAPYFPVPWSKDRGSPYYYDSRTRILEKDVIEFVGEVNGIYRYQTVRGDIRDISELYVHELKVIQ